LTCTWTQTMQRALRRSSWACSETRDGRRRETSVARAGSVAWNAPCAGTVGEHQSTRVHSVSVATAKLPAVLDLSRLEWTGLYAARRLIILGPRFDSARRHSNRPSASTMPPAS